MTARLLLASGGSLGPLDHVLPHRLSDGGGWLLYLTNQRLMMVLGALLLIIVLPLAVRRRRGTSEVDALTPAGFGNFVESVCHYLRKEVAQPVLGTHTDRFIKYIWSVFFFILILNLLGLVPFDAAMRLAASEPVHIGGTATGNFWMTGALAFCTMVMMVVNGLRFGGKAYVAHFCPGPLIMAPLLVPVEIIGLIAKIFALTVRLFANMIAGHILLAVLMTFTALAWKAGTLTGVGITGAVVLGSVAINLLELFVAFLQAFIFSFLTTLFIGMSVNVHHDDEHEHEHEHAHGEIHAATH